MNGCVFCNIIKGEIPCKKIYEDNDFFCFMDIKPISKGHVLVVPKKHCENILDFPTEASKRLVEITKKLATIVVKAVGADGFNVGMNNGKAAGQAVFHAHLHIIPRFDNDGLSSWPGKDVTEEELNFIKDKIVTFL
jgi:histidine triad (HIT) family protein